MKKPFKAGQRRASPKPRNARFAPNLALDLEAVTQRDKAEIDAKYPEGRNPIKHALAVAVCERAARLSALVPQDPPNLDRLIPALPEVERLWLEFKELERWVEVPIRSDSERLAHTSAAINALVDAGLTPHQIVEASQDWQATPRGRPATTRFVAVDALELWLLNPRMSWARVTREVCICGAADHGHDCQERVRQQINDLRGCLKKYGIKEPPRMATSASSS